TNNRKLQRGAESFEVLLGTNAAPSGHTDTGRTYSRPLLRLGIHRLRPIGRCHEYHIVGDRLRDSSDEGDVEVAAIEQYRLLTCRACNSLDCGDDIGITASTQVHDGCRIAARAYDARGFAAIQYAMNR